VEPLERRVCLGPKEDQGNQDPVAIEGQWESKVLKGILARQDHGVRGARKVTVASLVQKALQGLQGLQGSRVREDYRASLGYQEQGENPGQRGHMDHQEPLDLRACLTPMHESTPSSGP